MDIDLAFNAGSDARLRGEPMSAVPDALHGLARRYWFAGWQSVHQGWGHESGGTARPLPPVRPLARISALPDWVDIGGSD